MKLLRFIIFLLLVSANSVSGQYTIKGQVNLGPDWQPKVFMAAVKKLSDYYRTNPDMIVNMATVNPDGTFIMKGDNLPEEPRFYRLYLMKIQNTDYDACLYVGGDDHNFAHVLLKNGETVEIIADSQSIAPFGNYQIKGQPANHLMQQLARIVFPSFYFYRIKFPTELKFSEDKLHINLKQFADTCSNTLVALAAVNNTDFDEYFDTDKAFYQRFGQRLKAEIPNSIYTKNYLLKIKYHANEESTSSTRSTWLISLLMAGIIGLLYQLYQYRQRIENLELQVAQTSNKAAPAPLSLGTILTHKEKEILRLIYEGKTNKEIAANQFVELSTVKTHINKIYAKMGVSNRREAQSLANQLFE